jgi:hypothetical protein
MIKPIETAAFGRLFRSRHEARVACFLSHLGAKWEYESQGFELPSGLQSGFGLNASRAIQVNAKFD